MKVYSLNNQMLMHQHKIPTSKKEFKSINPWWSLTRSI